MAQIVGQRGREPIRRRAEAERALGRVEPGHAGERNREARARGEPSLPAEDDVAARGHELRIDAVRLLALVAVRGREDGPEEIERVGGSEADDETRAQPLVGVPGGQEAACLGVVALEAEPRATHVPAVSRRVVEGRQRSGRARGIDPRRRRLDGDGLRGGHGRRRWRRGQPWQRARDHRRRLGGARRLRGRLGNRRESEASSVSLRLRMRREVGGRRVMGDRGCLSALGPPRAKENRARSDFGARTSD